MKTSFDRELKASAERHDREMKEIRVELRKMVQRIEAQKRARVKVKTLEDPYLMANLFPKTTGLPFVVWISEHGHARHDVRVKAARGPKAIPGEMASVAVRPDIRLVEGKMAAEDFALLKTWIERNREVLVEYWDSEIDTAEAINRLVRV